MCLEEMVKACNVIWHLQDNMGCHELSEKALLSYINQVLVPRGREKPLYICTTETVGGRAHHKQRATMGTARKIITLTVSLKFEVY